MLLFNLSNKNKHVPFPPASFVSQYLKINTSFLILINKSKIFMLNMKSFTDHACLVKISEY